jgi:hypothetical protein
MPSVRSDDVSIPPNTQHCPYFTASRGVLLRWTLKIPSLDVQYDGLVPPG